MLGRDRPPLGNHIYGAFGQDFLTADGETVMVAAITIQQWRALISCCGIGQAVASAEERLGLDFTDEVQRFEGRDTIVSMVAPWFAARTFEVVKTQLQEHQVSWGKYATVTQLLQEDTRVGLQNPIYEQLTTDGVGQHLAAQLATRFEGVQRTPGTGAPLLGAHTDEVLHQVLGLSGIEVARLHDAKVVAGPSADPFF
ncbi:Formyl-CoA:oxalate CoA-transferase [compost metagenome]